MSTPHELDIDRAGRLEGLPDGARVVVAMSGGVDSSLVAALLKRRGYEVVGITLQLYDHGAATARAGACCAGRDIRDARRVAESLGIAHYVLDYEARFRDSVIDGFADSYLAGETPIPCVACNQSIKFSGLLDTAREIGAAALVTGHYVDWRLVDGRPALYRAKDQDRDQSYFLFATGIRELEYLRFPLGGMHKADVRALARGFGLPVAEKADSQDICFVPTGRYAQVIERLRPGAVLPGRIVHVDGRDLGHHTGIINFTIGQRRGLGVASGEPLYVVRLDAARQQVVVGPREHLLVRTIMLKNVNWLGQGPLASLPADEGCGLEVRLRSTQKPQPARLFFTDGKARVRLDEPDHGIAPGQACVFYQNDTTGSRMLGGGWIEGTSADDDLRAGFRRSAASGDPSGEIALGHR